MFAHGLRAAHAAKVAVASTHVSHIHGDHVPHSCGLPFNMLALITSGCVQTRSHLHGLSSIMLALIT